MDVVIDTETRGLRIFNGEGPTWINHRVKKKNNLVDVRDNGNPRQLDKLFDLLTGDSTLIFHNAPFDLCVLSLLGDKWRTAVSNLDSRRVFDILAAYHLIDPSQNHSLLACAKNLLGERELAHRKITQQQYEDGTVDPEYMRFDLEIPERLKPLFDNLLKVKQIKEIWESSVQPLLPISTMMRIRGLPVNIELATKVKSGLEAEIMEIQERLTKLGCPVEMSKKRKVADWAESLWPNSLPKSPTGQPSLDAKKIAALKASGFLKKGIDVFLTEYLKGSHLQSLAGYVSGYIEASLSSIDGNIHPGWNQSGTVTDRFSASPNSLMNIPKRDQTWGSLIRKIFYPTNGYCFVGYDYAGIEFRIFADETKDESLIKEIVEGDPHMTTAKLMFRRIPKKFEGAMRTTGKHYNFLRIYGGGPEEAARLITQFCFDAKIPQNLVRSPDDVLDDWIRLRPKAASWAYDSAVQARRERKVKNRFGRCLPVPKSKEYMAPNRLIQSTVSQLVRRSMVRMEKAGLPVVCQLHDEVWTGPYKYSEANDAAEIMEESMLVDKDRFRVPLKVERMDLKG